MNAVPQIPTIVAEDRTPAMRLPLEYAFIAPPVRQGFSAGGRKKNLIRALAEMGNAKSVILLSHEISVNLTMHEKGDRWENQRNKEWVYTLLDFANEPAFDLLSRLWNDEEQRKQIETGVAAVCGHIDRNEDYDRRIALKRKWLLLASGKREYPQHKSFAEWLIRKAETTPKE